MLDISRGEFGARVGAPRILDLLKRYDIKSTWFVPGHTAETFPDICKRVSEEGHEIGYHGYLHEYDPPAKKEVKIFEKAISALKRITGQTPVGYRLCGLDLATHTIKRLIKEGFTYDSSLMGNDFQPYRVRVGDKWSYAGPYKFGQETMLVEIPISWYLDDWPAFSFSWEPFRYAFTSIDTVYQYWARQFDYMYKNVHDGVYNICLHPQVIGRGHLIMMLEDLIRHMKDSANIRFCTLQEVAAEFDRSRSALLEDS